MATRMVREFFVCFIHRTSTLSCRVLRVSDLSFNCSTSCFPRFIEWKYRLIVLLLMMTVLFHMGLTTFVVQASQQQVMEQVTVAFQEKVDAAFQPG